MAKNYKLVNCRGRLQINGLPFSRDNALANLGRGLVLLVHLICVIDLFHAGGTLRPVRAFEATVQALVSHATIAIAVTRLLIDDVRDLRGQLVGVRLERILIVVAPELSFAEDWR